MFESIDALAIAPELTAASSQIGPVRKRLRGEHGAYRETVHRLSARLGVLVSTIVQLEAAHLRLWMTSHELAGKVLCPLGMIRTLGKEKRPQSERYA